MHALMMRACTRACACPCLCDKVPFEKKPHWDRVMIAESVEFVGVQFRLFFLTITVSSFGMG